MVQVMQLRVNGAVSIQELNEKLEEHWYKIENVKHQDPKQRWNQFKIYLLLNTLPSEYDHMVTHMQATLDLTYDKAVKRLRHKELYRENVQKQQGTAMSVVMRPGNKGFRKRSQTETRECFWCKRTRHIQRDCTIWKREQRKNSGNNGNGDDNTSTDSKASIAFDLEQLEKILATHEPSGKTSQII
ncbi:hypothetical protein FGG08_007392 [Glutinoglossum americanum]|uniref:CCHC-type domain-containing protein n=1 Tax=Glutinoglossum americanum TaxID=1670608 RepID=A0A9P8KZD9_9PEZI|nr:hypothetical protein FGG08_007392 [Glutinoglossum americanum]